MKKYIAICHLIKNIECIIFCDGFWSYFLFIWQVDYQVLLIVHFTVLSPNNVNVHQGPIGHQTQFAILNFKKLSKLF
jgi:hypothetical protein